MRYVSTANQMIDMVELFLVAVYSCIMIILRLECKFGRLLLFRIMRLKRYSRLPCCQKFGSLSPVFQVPLRAEEITIPADVTPERVPTHIVDYSGKPSPYYTKTPLCLQE